MKKAIIIACILCVLSVLGACIWSNLNPAPEQEYLKNEQVSDIKADPEPVSEPVVVDDRYEKAMLKVYAQADINASYPNTLTISGGVYRFNGKRETYYGPSSAYAYKCTRDLRDVWRIQKKVNYHVAVDANDGSYYFIDDVNGVPTWLFVIASSEISKGTIREISYGLALVMDCGCANGTVDVFVGPKWYA